MRQPIFATYTGSIQSSVCFVLQSMVLTTTISHLSLVGAVLQTVLTLEIASSILGNGGEDSPAAMVSNNVDVATLKRGMDKLDQKFNVRVISADRNLDEVLDMEDLYTTLCREAPNSPSVSDTEPTNHGHIANPFKWVQCVKGRNASGGIVSNSCHSCSWVLFLFLFQHLA